MIFLKKCRHISNFQTRTLFHSCVAFFSLGFDFKWTTPLRFELPGERLEAKIVKQAQVSDVSDIYML